MGLKKVVGGLLVTLGVMDKPFTDGMKRAGKNLKGFESGLGSTAKKLIAFGASYLAIRKVTSSITGAMQSIDKLAKTSDKLGIATDSLVGLQHAASLTGVDINKLNMGLQRMTRRIAEAGQGTGEARGALRELRLDAEALAKKSPDEQFKDIADAMSLVANQADRVRLGFKLFDAEGVDLINTLELGRAGLVRMQMRAERLGLVVSRDLAKGVEEANDAITELKSLFDGIARQVAAQLAPVIRDLTNDFIAWATEGEPVSIKVINMMESITLSVHSLVYTIKDAKKGIDDFWKALSLNPFKSLQRTSMDFRKREAAQMHAQWQAVQKWGADSKKQYANVSDAASDYNKEVARVKETFEKMRDSVRKRMEETGASYEDLTLRYRTMFEDVAQLERDAARIAEEAANMKMKHDDTWAAAKKRHLDEIADKEKEAAKERWATIHKEQEIRQSNFDFITSGLRDIVSNSNMSAREQFKVNKALNLADAVMNTATAVTKYHALGRPGMAVAAGIIGAAQVAAIASTSFEGGGGGGVAAAATSMPMETMQEPSRTVNINLGDSRGRFSRDEIMSIMDGVSEAVGDGVQFNFA